MRTPDGECHKLHCVHDYVHLGTVRNCDGIAGVEIQRRAQITREAYKPFRNRILRNTCLEVCERQTLFKAMVLSKFMHGAGTWTFRGDACRHAYASQYMSFVHGAIRPMWSVPSTHLSQEQACALVAVMLPDEAIAVHCVRTLEQLVRRADDYP